MDSRYLIMGSSPSQFNQSDDATIPVVFSTQEINAGILAQLDLPASLIENANIIKAEREKITSLRYTVERSDAIAKVTLHTLTKFLFTVNSLEQLLTPMHKETIGIVTAQRNIDSALREVHGVLDNLDSLQIKKDPNTGLSLSPESLSDRLHSDYQEFIHHLFELIESQKYWTTNIKFAGAERILKHMNELIASSAHECAIEFDKILSMSSKTVDLARAGWPLPPKFEWVADTVLDRLGSIAQGLVVSQNSGIDPKVLQGLHQGGAAGNDNIDCKPLHSLLVHRTPFLKATYKLLLQNHSALVQGGGFNAFLQKIAKPTRTKKQSQFYAIAETSRTAHPSITQAQYQHDQGQEQTVTTTTTTSELVEDGDQLGRYTKGTHQIIFLTDVLLGILELELNTWETILSRCDGLEQEDIDNAFCITISPVLETFSKVIGDFIHSTSPNKLLFTLDVLGHFQSLQGRFRQTLKRGVDRQDSFRIFMSLKNDVTVSLQSSLLTHIINSVKISKFTKDSRRDGSIADVTVESVTFLRALCTYDDVLDTLPPEVAYIATTKPFFSEKNGIPTATSQSDLHSGEIHSHDPSTKQTNSIPTLQDVITLNERLSKDAKEKYIFDNGGSAQGFVWKTVLPLSILPGLGGTRGLCTVSQGVVWDVLQGLDATLQVRAETLKLPSLQWLFYLNNYHHIAQAATKHYFRVHPLFLTYYINKTQRSKILYQTHTFQAILGFLDTTNYDKKIELPDKKLKKIIDQQRKDGTYNSGIQLITPQYAKLIKSKFAGFNKGFRETFQAQKLYSVPDGDLRGQLRSESVDIIIPMFESFLDKYAELPFSTKHKGEYLCYTKELLETLLNKFFDELT